MCSPQILPQVGQEGEMTAPRPPGALVPSWANTRGAAAASSLPLDQGDGSLKSPCSKILDSVPL